MYAHFTIYVGSAGTIYIRCIPRWYVLQGFNQTYGHIWRICTVLANPTYMYRRTCNVCTRMEVLMTNITNTGMREAIKKS